MARTPYYLTSFSPQDYYSCSTYAPEISTRYGIWGALGPPAVDSSVVDLSSRSLLGVSVGDWIASCFMLFVLGMFIGMYLGFLYWFLDRTRSKRCWNIYTAREKSVSCVLLLEAVFRRLINRVKRWSRWLKNGQRKMNIEMRTIGQILETFQKSFGIWTRIVTEESSKVISLESMDMRVGNIIFRTGRKWLVKDVLSSKHLNFRRGHALYLIQEVWLHFCNHMFSLYPKR